MTLANDVLLPVAGNDGFRGWGKEGGNGGQVTFTAEGQALTGMIKVDEISTLSLILGGGSSLNGTINPDGQSGEAAVTLEEGSTWILTGDAYLTGFEGDVGSITANGYHVYVNGTAIN